MIKDENERSDAGVFTRIMITAGMIYGSGVSVSDILTGCRFVYNFDTFAFEFHNCSEFISNVEVVYPVFAAAATSLIGNVLIALWLIKGVSMGAGSTSKDGNTRMFWQGFAQELFFANDLIWQQFLSNLVDSPWWQFLSCSFMWELAHTCDGLMFLVFNEQMNVRSNFSYEQEGVDVNPR
ncbi:hypothetical protein ANCCEY_00830 [Ancylostoma ceylanicum]|uniref:7TM GPCR serpentine receptor class x (Srx) domain-containing protein n=1 Tax=Ancylostoma ceylanicum TaxID=53326 RepID=A0A0D6MD42_9BILA|nr:hypothetical protein ANCCEY_00830 [Ancylostoma ceylanicum]